MERLVPDSVNPSSERPDPERQKFEAQLSELVAQATATDRHRANEIASGEPDAIKVRLTPVLAALIFKDHNGRNRDFSLAKAKKWARAMARPGEWKLTHQGIAFAKATDRLIDGQHRCAAVVLSKGGAEGSIEFWGFRRQDAKVIDAIDQSDKRNAWEALKLDGIADAQEKERIAKAVMAYKRHCDGNHLSPSVIEIEQYVFDNDRELSVAIEIGRQSIQSETVADPTLSATQASMLAHLLQDDVPVEMIRTFIFALQRGVDSHEHGVIVPAAKLLINSNRAEQRRDRLSRDQIFSTLLRAFTHWVRSEAVAKFKASKAGQLTPYRLGDVMQTVAPTATTSESAPEAYALN